MLGSDPAGTFGRVSTSGPCAASLAAPTPGLHDPLRDKAPGAGGLGRREPLNVRLLLSCLPTSPLSACLPGPGLGSLYLSSYGLVLEAAGVLACSDQAEEEFQP